MEIKLFSKESTTGGLTTKVMVLGFLVLLLMIPLEIIKSTIMERQRTGEEAMKTIEEQWGKAQTVGAPMLNIPYTEIISDGQLLKEVHKIAHFLPNQLNVKAEIQPEVRYRSIYKTVVYQSNLTFNGNFTQPDFSVFSPHKIMWKDAYITVGVSENRGFKNEVHIQINDKNCIPEPGIPDNDIFSTGINARLGIDSISSMNFEISFALSGSRSLELIPLGKTTHVEINSTWKDPNFIGDFLPANRTITDDGFSANWTVTHLNRNFPQSWTGKNIKVASSAFGVELYMPVDHYQKSYRSAKYGLLFIILTFLVFIFTEITSDKKIQFFHYLLVAIALILFFSLLTALSEQLGFNLAYLISSLCTIALITLFTKSITKLMRIALQTLMVLSILYSFMFVLLQMKEFAYLAGNIGLFLILAAIMWVTSRIIPKELSPNNSNKKDIGISD